MKKIISILLIAVIVLSLCACGGSGEGEQQGLQVGFGREKIHPSDSVPLGGYGNTSFRMSTGALDLLYATCIAYKDGDTTILQFTQDLIRSDNTWTPEVRKLIEKETGVPYDNILVAATHTHSAPDTSSDDPSITKYKEEYKKGMLKAAQAAIADLTPATLYGTKTELEGMNFIRHYTMADGTYAGSNFGDWSSGIIGHAAENDPEMRIVKIEREGEKQDIMIMNWQAHPCCTGGTTETMVSADYIAPCRSKIEKDTGMLFAYFLGASGNHNTGSLIDSEDHGLDNKGYGEKLAQTAIDALPNLQAIEGTGIQTVAVNYVYPLNHDDEDKLTEAQQVVDLWTSTGSRDQGNALAKKLGFASVYHASAALQRPNRPQEDDMMIYATRIGGMAFINAPYEMFAASGRYIMDNSPFDMTLICTCSNWALGYYPTMEAYDYGCYESQTSYFARGVAEATADKYVEMLKGLQ